MNAVFHGTDEGVNRVTDGDTSEGETRYGHLKWLTTDYGVGQQIALYGEYSEGEVVIFRKLLKRGDVVLSAGANIGAHLLPLSQIVGGDGRVITFEPQSFLLPILYENLKVNGCTNVEVHEKALGATSQVALLATSEPTMPQNFGGLYILDPHREQMKANPVEMVTIDSLDLQRLDFLMLDIEGQEENALRGAVDTIARCRPYLYVEIDKEDRREPLLHYIKDELGYEVLFHLPTVYNPDNFAKNKKNSHGDQRSIMCLAIPS